MRERINKDLLVSYKTVYNPQKLCGSTEKVITVLSSSIKKTELQGTLYFWGETDVKAALLIL